MDMSVHRRPRAQGEGRGRLKGAMIAGLVTLACLIVVPVELFELILASSGLSELLPVLAPPIGWPVRIVLTLCGAAIAAVVAWGGGGHDVPAVGIPVGDGDAGAGMKRNGIMGWTRNLGLHHLARLARGGEDMADAYPSSVPRMRGPALPKLAEVPPLDLLHRSRKDMHPDAPPRAPLVASRDLPAVTELSVIESGPDVAPPPPPIACASPIRDTTGEERPRPLPRSPAPLSDSDLSWVRGLLVERDQRKAPVAASSSTEPRREAVTVAAVIAENPDAPASLMSLLDRFEQGVAHRIALRDAANAIERVGESHTGQTNPVAALENSATPTAPTIEVEDAVAEFAQEQPEDIPLEIDEALNVALATLRKLSVKANGR